MIFPDGNRTPGSAQTDLLATTGPASQPARFPFLDAIRGICIFGVVAIHCFYSPNKSTNTYATIYSSMMSSGWLGVPIFFVLSGFLIPLPIFSDPDGFDWKRYAQRRIAKIVPPFVIVVAVIALVETIWHGRPLRGVCIEVLASLSTIAHFWQPWPPLNGAFWSLYVEVHFYLLLPFLFFGIRHLLIRKSKDAATVTAGIVVAFFLLFPLFFRVLDAVYLGYFADHESHRFALFPRVMDYFAWGMLFGLFFAKNPCFPVRRARLIGWVGGGGLLAVYGLYAVGKYFNHAQIPYWLVLEGFHLVTPLFATLSLFLCYEKICSFPVFKSRALIFMGVVSYEWYLLHGPVMIYLRPFTSPAGGNPIIYLWNTGAPLSLALAATLYFAVSKPLLKLAHQRKPPTP